MEKQGIGFLVGIPTAEELNAYFGLPKCSRGMAFKTHDGGDFYLQREADVLHLGLRHGFCMNSLHPGFLNRLDDKISITIQEFTVNMKKVIYEEELYNFWDKI